MGIAINVTGKEASSAPMEPVPGGKYLVTVTDAELRESKSAKNKGKPFAALELTITETGSDAHDKYAGRKMWANVMLFEGALYSAVQILKALGQNVDEGEMEFPELDELVGEQFVIRCSIQKEREYTDESGEVKNADARNEVKGWYKPTEPVKPGVEVQRAGSATAGRTSPYASTGNLA
jgi:hypothetical protein